MTSLRVRVAAARAQQRGKRFAEIAIAGRRTVLHRFGRIVEQRAVKGAAEVVQRKRFGRGMSGRER